MNLLKDQRGVALALELALVAIVVGLIGVAAVKVGGSQASRSGVVQEQPSSSLNTPRSTPTPKCTIVNPDGTVTTKTDDSPCVAR